jgi:triphosphoribosyl-dephospho-CoA synthase
LAAGAEPAIAQVNALMAVMRHLEDTCVLYRGGTRSLKEMQRGAGRVLDAGGASTREGMEQLLLLDALRRRAAFRLADQPICWRQRSF